MRSGVFSPHDTSCPRARSPRNNNEPADFFNLTIRAPPRRYREFPTELLLTKSHGILLTRPPPRGHLGFQLNLRIWSRPPVYNTQGQRQRPTGNAQAQSEAPKPKRQSQTAKAPIPARAPGPGPGPGEGKRGPPGFGAPQQINRGKKPTTQERRITQGPWSGGPTQGREHPN